MVKSSIELKDASSYLKILEASDEGIIVVQDELIVFNNQAALNISEYPQDIYIKTPISKIVHPDDVPRIMDYHHKRIAGEPAPSFVEGRYLTYSGEERWMQLNVSLVEWESKPATVIFISDITDRKYREAKFSAAFQAAGCSLTIRDMKTKKFEHVNNEFTDLTGFLPSEVIGKTPVEIGLLSEDDELVIQQKMAENGAIKDFMVPINRPDNSTRWGLYSAELINFGRKQSLISVTVDMTEYKAQQEKIEIMAMTDPLTELSNRNCFNDKFDNAIAIASREKLTLALLLIDLDLFKAVNDSYGHQAGDEVLINVAHILKDGRRGIDAVARLGGDEFALMLFSPRSKQDVEAIATNLIQAICQPIDIDGNNVQIGASIGAAFYPADGNSLDEIFQKADKALYASKHNGRNQLTFYQADGA